MRRIWLTSMPTGPRRRGRQQRLLPFAMRIVEYYLSRDRAGRVHPKTQDCNGRNDSLASHPACWPLACRRSCSARKWPAGRRLQNIAGNIAGDIALWPATKRQHCGDTAAILPCRRRYRRQHSFVAGNTAISPAISPKVCTSAIQCLAV